MSQSKIYQDTVDEDPDAAVQQVVAQADAVAGAHDGDAEMVLLAALGTVRKREVDR